MNPISIKQTIRLKLDRLFHIDRKGEYGMMASTAYLSPDTVLFSKKKSIYGREYKYPWWGNDLKSSF